MTAAEAADQARAGITRTESAFAYGNKLFDQTWGGSAADPYVAAAGNVAADPAGQQAASEDVLGLMEAYRDEPRLGAVSRAKAPSRRSASGGIRRRRAVGVLEAALAGDARRGGGGGGGRRGDGGGGGDGVAAARAQSAATASGSR